MGRFVFPIFLSVLVSSSAFGAKYALVIGGKSGDKTTQEFRRMAPVALGLDDYGYKTVFLMGDGGLSADGPRTESKNLAADYEAINALRKIDGAANPRSVTKALDFLLTQTKRNDRITTIFDFRIACPM